MARVFKIGTQRIVEDETTRDLNPEQVRDLLRRQYPEVANATINTREQDGVTVIEYLPQPGRKG